MPPAEPEKSREGSGVARHSRRLLSDGPLRGCMLSALITVEISLLVFVVLSSLVYVVGPRGVDYEKEAEEFVAAHFEKQHRRQMRQKGKVQHL
jgi:hypothetical protein